uniref:Uncharacterized protein n=1 Tax=Chromera velia CCMP2878 TaxID=1169474 RepID=A0A0G4HRV7_9ALVE|eukprot:Cvel_8146.t1-p1 / transcript=Cvel_8146.t1 / gene=Cvel_8146 / organism=Chromera_velia_CCMP2878 / gene_product=hypothetical protein / transcript_product=hypothetical protein / location=Cvel_scaffold443:42618-43535(-) / protein_length=306 / sequence_SO=supercontig / SO=protein_coding / is_pseudo=false
MSAPAAAAAAGGGGQTTQTGAVSATVPWMVCVTDMRSFLLNVIGERLDNRESLVDIIVGFARPTKRELFGILERIVDIVDTQFTVTEEDQTTLRRLVTFSSRNREAVRKVNEQINSPLLFLSSFNTVFAHGQMRDHDIYNCKYKVDFKAGGRIAKGVTGTLFLRHSCQIGDGANYKLTVEMSRDDVHFVWSVSPFEEGCALEQALGARPFPIGALREILQETVSGGASGSGSAHSSSIGEKTPPAVTDRDLILVFLRLVDGILYEAPEKVREMTHEGRHLWQSTYGEKPIHEEVDRIVQSLSMPQT